MRLKQKKELWFCRIRPLTTLRSVFKAEAETTKKKRQKVLLPPILRKQQEDGGMLTRGGGGGGGGPLGRRDQLRLTCVSTGCSSLDSGWLRATDAL